MRGHRPRPRMWSWMQSSCPLWGLVLFAPCVPCGERLCEAQASGEYMENPNASGPADANLSASKGSRGAAVERRPLAVTAQVLVLRSWLCGIVLVPLLLDIPPQPLLCLTGIVEMNW